MWIKKSKRVVLATMIILILSACGKNQEELPNPAPDQAEYKLTDIFEQERSAFLTLYENPSVTQARIKNNLSDRTYHYEYYSIDLDNATACIEDLERTVLTYALDEIQVEQLKSLLSKYTLTVYDDKPYWPTGDYCTMIELFEFIVTYKDGSFREYGATHYPDGWDQFIRDLRELITNEQESEETHDTDVYKGAYEYSGYIGDSQVYMSLVINEPQVLIRRYFSDEAQTVSGEYFCVDSPEPISVYGYVKGNGLHLFSYSDDGSGPESFVAIREPDGSLKGMWQGSGPEYTCYLKESSGESQVFSKPAMEWEQPPEHFSGTWYGINSDYFKYSQMRFIPLYDDLIYFELNTVDGHDTGEMNGIGRYDGEQISFVEDKVVFTFSAPDDKNIMLDANNYEYRCPLGLVYEAQYGRREEGLIMPEKLDFLTPEQNEQLKALTGARYQDFLAVAHKLQQVYFTEVGEDLMIFELGLEWDCQDAFVLIRHSDGYMSAGLNNFNEADNRSEIHYFEARRDSQIWEIITDWCREKEIVIQN